MMTANEIRTKYLEFFRSKGHTIVPSDSLVPANDPTLLFTGAGMNQFKEQFIGKNITYRRATSSQKCLRTGDLENVGRTSGHHTFFEMLGNFSFGDYFKKEACSWAWEFMTGVLTIPRERLWISVYQDDREAYDIWKDIVGIKPERMVKFGAKDNFWPSNAPTDGPDGPCGPCSEIYYDWGADTGCKKSDCSPACSCGRFIEVWNLVFTQFNRVGVNDLKPLPSKNIDTGMGLERITAVIQGVKTNFETDLFQPIIQELKLYARNANTPALNAMTDHLRASVFTIADGVSPSNEERGYVVRKLIRRAYLLGNIREPFLYKAVPRIVSVMELPYPELKAGREHISAIIKEEEEKFRNTLIAALPKLEEIVHRYRGERRIPGPEIFKLTDTFGLPFEVIADRARELGYSLDESGFEALMDERKELSRSGSKITGSIFVEGSFAKAPLPPVEDKDPLTATI
ncbi:MAG: alanine--tRNA ligase, partial [Candidatus Omnitrophica bacterium]|nr:alanine--tRNA ligase [Candidatus Omnitrophota bacterium]